MQIYMIKNKINNKAYIGQTIHNFDYRYAKKWWKNTHNILLKYSINKYGKENFEILILEDNINSLDELNQKEIYYIEKHQTYDQKFGYNLRLGGENGGACSEDMLKAMSETTKKMWERPEYREKLSKAHLGQKPSHTSFKKGQIPWNKDKKGVMPEAWNKNTKGICRPNKTSFKKGMISPNSIKIVRSDGKEYNSITEASKYNNCCRITMKRRINDKKSINGYTFKEIK